MESNRKRVVKRLASGLMAGALALGGLAISGASVSAKTPSSPTTNRLAGDDRYETAVEIARDLYDTVADIDGMVIVSGEKPYDALAASVLAGDTKPILLVKSDSVPASVLDFISDVKSKLKNNVTKIYVIGGTSVISDEVLTAISTAATTAGDTTPPTTTRISGADRYKTAAAIAAVSGTMVATDKLILVNGADGSWADALSAAMLSSQQGWPIVTTSNGGLNDDAKATIDAYLELPASAASFLIIGGPAVMPTSVEEYLIGEGVAPADIRRLQGADRYGTNLAIQLYMVENGLAGGVNVVLASGVAPWDALAASPWAAYGNALQAKHVVLTPTNAPSAEAATLAAVLADGGAAAPAALYVVGGKSAVAETARLGFMAAAQSVDIAAPTISGCVEGSTKITMTSPTKFSGDETDSLEAAGKTLFEIDGVAQTGALTLDSNDGAGLDSAAKAFTGNRVKYSFTVSSALEAGTEIEFLGIEEGDTVNTHEWARSVAGASCEVPADSVAPVITLTAATVSGSPFLVLKSSEPIQETWLEQYTTPVSWAGSGSTGLSGLAGAATVAATPLNLTNTAFKLTLTGGQASFINDPTATTSATGVLLTIAKGAIKDRAGNAALVDSSAVIKADAVAPTAAASLVECVQGDDISSVTHGSLKVTAAGFTGTSKLGAGGNAWDLKVVNQRGKILPTVVADSETKVITITSDTGYHTVNDVVTAARNAGLQGLLGSWTFSVVAGEDGTDLVGETVTNGNFAGGTSDCNVLFTPSEAVENTGKPVLTVAGVTIPASALTVTHYGASLSAPADSFLININEAGYVGDAVFTWATSTNILEDLTGNEKAFSATATLG